jgi:hypothetical protein
MRKVLFFQRLVMSEVATCCRLNRMVTYVTDRALID